MPGVKPREGLAGVQIRAIDKVRASGCAAVAG